MRANRDIKRCEDVGLLPYSIPPVYRLLWLLKILSSLLEIQKEIQITKGIQLALSCPIVSITKIGPRRCRSGCLHGRDLKIICLESVQVCSMCAYFWLNKHTNKIKNKQNHCSKFLYGRGFLLAFLILIFQLTNNWDQLRCCEERGSHVHASVESWAIVSLWSRLVTQGLSWCHMSCHDLSAVTSLVSYCIP